MIVSFKPSWLKSTEVKCSEIRGCCLVFDHMHHLIELRIDQSLQRTPLTIHKTLAHRTSIGGKHPTNVILAHIIHILKRASFKQLNQGNWSAINQNSIAIVIHFAKKLVAKHPTMIIMKRLN